MARPLCFGDIIMLRFVRNDQAWFATDDFREQQMRVDPLPPGLVVPATPKFYGLRVVPRLSYAAFRSLEKALVELNKTREYVAQLVDPDLRRGSRSRSTSPGSRSRGRSGVRSHATRRSSQSHSRRSSSLDGRRNSSHRRSSSEARKQSHDSSGSGAASEDAYMAGLMAREILEKRSNEVEQKRLEGTPVRVGQPFQLQNEFTGRFVTIDHHNQAHYETENFLVQMHSGSDGSILVVESPLKGVDQDEAVNLLEPVILRGLKSGLRLQMGGSQSMAATGSLGRELNAASHVRHQTVDFVPLRSHRHNRNDLLSGGSVIKLRHVETDCHMLIDDQSNVVLRGLVSTAKSALVDPTLSAQAMSGSAENDEDAVPAFWQVQVDSLVFAAGFVGAGSTFRLCNLATAQYLAVSLDGKRLETTRDPNESRTLFSFDAFRRTNANGNALHFGSVLKLASAARSWVAVASNEASGPSSAPASERPSSNTNSQSQIQMGSSNLTLGLTKSEREVDAFQLEVVHRVDQEVALMFQYFLHDVSPFNSPNTSYHNKCPFMQSAAAAIRRYREDLPTLLDGTSPNVATLFKASNQSASRFARGMKNKAYQMRVPVVLLGFLKLPSELGKVSMMQLADPDYSLLREFFNDVLVVLRALCQGHRPNAFLVGPHVDMLLTMGHLGLNVPDLLIDVMRLVPDVIHRVDDSMLSSVFERLRTAGMKPEVLKFLATSCYLDGRPFRRNQGTIINALTSIGADFIPHLTCERGTVLFSCGILKVDHVPIADMCSSSDDFVFVFARLVALLASCCDGRHEEACVAVERFVTLDACKGLVIDEMLPDELRVHACKLLRTLFIDREPQQLLSPTPVFELAAIKETRRPPRESIWPELEEIDSDNDRGGLRRRFDDLVAFCVRFCSENAALDVTEPDRLELVDSVSRLLLLMAELGLLSSEEVLDADIRAFIPILQTANDSVAEGQRYSAAPEFKAFRRAKKQSIEAMRVMHALFLKYCVKYLLFHLRHQLNEFLGDRTIESLRLDTQVPWNVEVMREHHRQIQFDKLQLARLVLDACLSESMSLSTRGFQLLFAFFSQNTDIVSLASRSVILHSDTVITLHKELLSVAERVGALANIARTPEQNEQLSALLTRLIELLEGPVETRFGLQSLVIVSGTYRHTEKLFFQNPGLEMLRLITKFTSAVMRKHRDGQAAFAHYVQNMVGVARLLHEGVDMLCSLIDDNERVASRIDENTLHALVGLLEFHPRSADVLRLLQIVVQPSGHPLPVNQQIVLKAFLSVPKHMCFCTSTEAKAHRSVWISRLDSKDDFERAEANKQLEYHIAFLTLITKCCEGKVAMNKARIKRLVAKDDLYEQVQDRTLPLSARAALLKMTRAVYFVEPEALDKDEKTWGILSYLLSEIQHFAVSVEAATASKLSSSLESRMDFVIESLSFVGAYFRQFFLRTFALPEVVKIGDHAADVIAQLASAHPFETSYPRLTMEVMNAQDVMRDRGLRGTSRTDLRIAARRLGAAHEAADALEQSEAKAVASEYKLHVLASSFCKQVSRLEEWRDLIEPMVFALKESDYRGIACLVRVLRQASVAKHRDLLVVGMRVLRLGLDFKDDVGDGEALLARLMDFEIVPVLMKHLCSEDELLSFEAVRLAELVFRGDQLFAAQIELYESWKSQPALAGLFYWLHQHVRTSIDTVKAHKRKLKGARTTSSSSGGLRSVRSSSSDASELFVEGLQGGGDSRAYVFEHEHFDPRSFRATTTLLRLMQQLCEGHYAPLQDAMREGSLMGISFSVVHDCVDLFAVVEKLGSEMLLLHRHNRDLEDLLVQVIRTLTEILQGNRGNQLALAPTSVFEVTSTVLSTAAQLRTRSNSSVSSAYVLRLQVAALDLALSMLEGLRETASAERLVTVLRLESLVTIMKSSRDSYLARPQWERVDEDLETGFKAFQLSQVLLDYDLQQYDEVAASLQSDRQVALFFAERVPAVEILRQAQLEKMYFLVPTHVHNLWKSPLVHRSKEDVLFKLDRDSTTYKLHDFLVRGQTLRYELKHQKRLTRNKCCRSLIRGDSVRGIMTMLLSILINMITLFTYSTAVDTTTTLQSADTVEAVQFERNGRYALYFLGAILLILSFESLIVFFLTKTPVLRKQAIETVVRRKIQKRERQLSLGEMNDDSIDNEDALRLTRLEWTRANIFILLRPMVLHIVLHFACCILGMWEPAFYAYHLFDVIAYNRLLQSVMSSVTRAGRSLASLFFLALLIVYVYSVIGFLFFRNKFTFANQFACETLFSCWITVISYGMRNDVGISYALLDTRPVTLSDTYAFGRFLFEYSYWVFIVIIFLAIIGAIIVDTFAAQRDHQTFILEDMRNVCFVCGLQRTQIDRYGSGFDRHTHREHNMWSYLFLFEYLSDRDPDNDTAQESYVRRLLERDDISFFPTGRTMYVDEESGEAAENAASPANAALEFANEHPIGAVADDLFSGSVSAAASPRSMARRVDTANIALAGGRGARMRGRRVTEQELLRAASRRVSDAGPSTQQQQQQADATIAAVGPVLESLTRRMQHLEELLLASRPTRSRRRSDSHARVPRSASASPSSGSSSSSSLSGSSRSSSPGTLQASDNAVRRQPPPPPLPSSQTRSRRAARSNTSSPARPLAKPAPAQSVRSFGSAAGLSVDTSATIPTPGVPLAPPVATLPLSGTALPPLAQQPGSARASGRPIPAVPPLGSSSATIAHLDSSQSFAAFVTETLSTSARSGPRQQQQQQQQQQPTHQQLSARSGNDGQSRLRARTVSPGAAVSSDDDSTTRSTVSAAAAGRVSRGQRSLDDDVLLWSSDDNDDGRAHSQLHGRASPRT